MYTQSTLHRGWSALCVCVCVSKVRSSSSSSSEGLGLPSSKWFWLLENREGSNTTITTSGCVVVRCTRESCVAAAFAEGGRGLSVCRTMQKSNNVDKDTG